MWLFLAFLLVPLIEIGLFIQVGGLIGLWPTLLIVVLTAVLGTYLVRAEGARAMNDLRRSFSQLEDPSQPLANGAMILVAGALLLTPGFFTDAVGFSLLIPTVRSAVFKWARNKVKVTSFQMGSDMHMRREPGRPNAARASEDVIDGEFKEVPQGKQPTHPGSGWTRH
ncbi:FxsA family protein [Sagittula sp. S175]|uniref:FxsA family protein n=1 Tax=Sagittula sp. S175 TaxID=3415129 RepID=UPI003C7A972D